LWFATTAHHVERTRRQLGARSHEFELDTLAMAALARAQSMPAYVASYERWSVYGFQLAQFLERYDLYLTPTLSGRPPRVGAVTTPPWAAAVTRALLPLGLGRLLSSTPSLVERIVLENMRNVPFTQLANIAGVPAMSVPLHRFSDGLPLGMHFLA